jgi:DNA-binding SARP family transcriptional activator
MSGLTISLFGKFRARRDQRSVSGLGAYRVQELLCYLLLHRDHTYPRETLAGLLWFDSPISQSRKFLRQALWRLQTALDPPTGLDSPLEAPVDPESTDGRILLVKPDWVHLRVFRKSREWARLEA